LHGAYGKVASLDGIVSRVKRPSLPFVAFMSCGLIWGSTFLAIRIGNDSLPALWACTLRFALAAILLNGILFATGGRWPKGEALRGSALYGLFEFGISMTLLYWGEKVVPSGLAAVIYAICPVVAMIAARLMGMEELNPVRLGAAVLALLGVAVIFWREFIQGGSAMGMAAIFVAAVAAPIAGLFLQRGERPNAIASNAVGTVLALPIALAFSFALGERHPIPSTPAEIFPVVYLALMGSLGAFVIFAWLMHHWRATTVSFLGVVVPVIAVILGSIVRKEALAPGSAVGAIVVILGVTIALRSEGYRKQRRVLGAVPD
jgi:drug/metabolite transporter (DMT)-like permease